MANLFMRKQCSSRKAYEQKYITSRLNLLLVVIFTAINLLLLIANADTYFLFSAFIPYYITAIGMLMCGRFPAEYYGAEFEKMVFFDNSLFIILLIVSIVITLLYLLAWFMSNKKRVGWLIFALVFFGLDTVGMLLMSGLAIDSLFDILFHAWVIGYLIVGISAHYKLKALPPEEETTLAPENISSEIECGEENADTATAQTSNSPIIREADKTVKHKVLLEKRTLNYDICYRRVKHTNELIINGNVYDELEGIVEPPHTLNAIIDGHHISAGYTGTHSFISVDGETVAKKLRLA